MATNKCSFCGALIPSGNRFCPNCGKPFIVSNVNTTQAAPPPAAAPPAAPPPAAVPTAPPPAAARPVAAQPVTTVVQQPQAQMPNAGSNPHQYEPKPKSNGLAVTIAIILSLAVLGGCGWAAYEFLIKDNSSEKQAPAKEKVESGASDAVSQETSKEASKEANTPETNVKVENDDEYFKFEDEDDNNGNSSTDVSQGLENDGNQETVQKQTTRRAPSTTKTAPSPKTAKKNNTQRRYSGEPMGMTDEEAAQMKRYNGEPMGMTDEEAAMMRKMNKRRR